MKPNECSGGCGLVMSGPDMWCLSCWPKMTITHTGSNPEFVIKDRRYTMDKDGILSSVYVPQATAE